MTLSLSLLQSLQCNDPAKAWQTIFDNAWAISSKPFESEKVDAEIARRDRAIGDIDLFLATGGWDLWPAYEKSVLQTSAALTDWWGKTNSGRAILILDALSLREVPWLLDQAKTRGFNIVGAKPTGAELPADTTPFAKALGFSQRSALGNNSAGLAHNFLGARTESVDMAWSACAGLVGSEPDWVFWHHWPDHRLHDHDDPGKGLSSLTDEIAQHLSGDAFWGFVDRLATGRRLILTSDHGYAASGLFPDSDKDQTDHLKTVFKSGRWDDQNLTAGPWVPPIDLVIDSKHGSHVFVNGRRKWKSAGGYPTLTHGGLTVLEVVVPFIELEKTNN